MILSIGTDIVNIARIERLIMRYGQRFVQRIYTPAEQAYCEGAKGERRIIRYANRFAAKEAMFKIIGTEAGIAWREIEVMRSPQGKPSVLLHGRADEVARQMVKEASSTYQFHLSLSDELPYCVAFVVMEAVALSSIGNAKE